MNTSFRPRFNGDLLASLLTRAAVLFGLGVVIYLMAQHVTEVLQRQNISTGFDFLSSPARFQIGEALIPFSPTDTYGRALIVALLNTLQVGLIGCVLATILGVIVGIARLSLNPLVSRISLIYVEIFRNTPILLQLFFWYAVIQILPPVRQSLDIFGVVFISQRGVQMPSFGIEDPFGILLIGVIALAISITFILRRFGPDGLRLAFIAGAIFLGLLLAAYGAGLLAVSLQTPELAGFGFRGGVNVSPEFLALLIGLVVYTASFIAEIVRGGIEAIPQAQTNSAASLGLTEGQTLRHVVLPQSLRIIVPPLVSEYLNLVKNSSLAVAIGYPDIVWAANTIINQTGQAIEGVLILTGVYLTLSVVTSLVLNARSRGRGQVSAAGVSQKRRVTMPSGNGIPAWQRPFAALFASPARAFTSIILLALIIWAAAGLSQWAFTDAVWAGTSQDCRIAQGACWAFVGEKLRFFLFGLYPYDEHWRPALTTLILIATVAVSMLPRFWKLWLPILWVAAFFIALWLMAGGGSPAAISTSSWGGIPVTLLLAISAIVISLPLGIGLAVARNSSSPTAQMLATGYIEIIRGVPLISILFLANTLLPLFLPGGAGVDKLLRAQIALTLFSAAYLAEAVRAGLSAVPKQQIAAAQSLGLGTFGTLRLVVLPQALQTALPGIVNTSIAIFKDTSLITIIGLFDLLGTVRAAGRDPAWLGFEIEGYVFAAAVYFIFCFAMSRYGLWLETRKPKR